MRPSQHAAATADGVLRLARDAQATVNGGPCARGGKAPTSVAAADPDVQPWATVTPGGLCLPTWEALFVDGVSATGTRDGLVDRLVPWGESVRERCATRPTLVIHREHGPANQSRRTQWMRRIVDVVPQYRVTVRRASAPPSHSPYHPLERCGGIREHQGNGALLDALDAVLQGAATLTWPRRPPVVTRVTTTSQPGVTLTKDAMAAVETPRTRLPRLKKWWGDVVYSPALIRDT